MGSPQPPRLSGLRRLSAVCVGFLALSGGGAGCLGLLLGGRGGLEGLLIGVDLEGGGEGRCEGGVLVVRGEDVGHGDDDENGDDGANDGLGGGDSGGQSQARVARCYRAQRKDALDLWLSL